MTNKTYFVVADVHGFYDEMQRALNAKGFDPSDPSHIFVSCGDLLDRGPQPKECIDFVMGLDPERRILIRGNHETLMFDLIYDGRITSADRSNGTVQTARDLTGESFEVVAIMEMKNCKTWWDYYDATVPYAETNKFVFVHGWIPILKTPGGRLVFVQDWRNGNWENAAWLNGMDMWSRGISLPDKTIVCGHWETKWGNVALHHFSGYLDEKEYYVPFIDDGIIALDACTVWTGMVNCMVIKEQN